jgi:hypothetical protein
MCQNRQIRSSRAECLRNTHPINQIEGSDRDLAKEFGLCPILPTAASGEVVEKAKMLALLFLSECGQAVVPGAPLSTASVFSC